jgi:alanine-glyoxylate transaminase/serine-glyoxylate transaminase/serine-pyruvate transaminase
MPSLLPDAERILLGPGPSATSPRVMRAMAAPTLSHLDPQMVALLDDVRARLARLFRAPDGSFALAISGTGTSGMETAVANLVREGTRVLVVVTGYFGDRLAQMCERYGARSPASTSSRQSLRPGRAAESAPELALPTSSRWCRPKPPPALNPIDTLAPIARAHGALTIVDAVSSFGGQPLDVEAWAIDACYSCTQKCLGAPSGLSPVVFSPRALEHRVKCRSFYFDLQLLDDFWLKRKYHHTMSSALVYALYEALAMVEEEGLEARWARHERNHHALVAGLAELGLSVLPPPGERLWTLNAVHSPDGIDEAAVRRRLLDESHRNRRRLGPLAGRSGGRSG